MKTAIMIIWMGLGQTQTFDTEQFPTIEICEQARTAMSISIKNQWSKSSQLRFLSGSICVEIPTVN